jgi:hypothetical protein
LHGKQPRREELATSEEREFRDNNFGPWPWEQGNWSQALEERATPEERAFRDNNFCAWPWDVGPRGPAHVADTYEDAYDDGEGHGPGEAWEDDPGYAEAWDEREAGATDPGHAPIGDGETQPGFDPEECPSWEQMLQEGREDEMNWYVDGNHERWAEYMGFDPEAQYTPAPAGGVDDDEWDEPQWNEQWAAREEELPEGDPDAVPLEYAAYDAADAYIQGARTPSERGMPEASWYVNMPEPLPLEAPPSYGTPRPGRHAAGSNGATPERMRRDLGERVPVPSSGRRSDEWGSRT